MNVKKLFLILPLLCSKVISVPIKTESVESEEEVFSDEDVNLIGEDNVQIVDIFSDDENIVTEVIDSTEEEECNSKECIETSKFILSNMDTSVNPCENFYQYACGGWEKENSERVLELIGSKINRIVEETIEGEYIVDETLDKQEQEYDKKTFDKLQSIYNICVKKEIKENYPNELVMNFIKNLNFTENKDTIKDRDTFTNLMVKLQTNAIELFTTFEPGSNEDISKDTYLDLKFSINIFIDTLYLMLNEHFPEVIPIYKDFIKNVLISVKHDGDIDSLTDSILNMELKLAKISQKNSLYKEMLTYNNIYGIPENYEFVKIKELNEKYPFMNWELYFKKIFEFYGIGDAMQNKEISVLNGYQGFFKDLSDMFIESEADDIINFIEWKIIRNPFFNEFISDDIKNSNAELGEKSEEMMYSLMNDPELFKEIYGIDLSVMYGGYGMDEGSFGMDEVLKKRDFEGSDDNVEFEKSYCRISLNKLMPLAISRFFVEKYGKNNIDKIKEEAEKMVENIKEAMIARTPDIEWLDEETKQYVIEKTMKMKEKIGYPDEILDPKLIYTKYENLKIDNYLDFVISEKAYEFGSKLIDAFSKNFWILLPHEVGAYHEVNDNAMRIPAGILQEPLFTISGQDYINYGGIGSIIGHELTHAFDNNGRLYDANGDLNNWWTDNDAEDFNNLSQCFIDEYDSFTDKIDGRIFNVNGKQTLGENIADNGGLARAYDAWQISLLKNPERAAKHNKKLPGLEDFTLDQLFYIVYGQSKCERSDPGKELDAHSPGIARVNGVVMNSQHFAKTFNCPINSPMNPEKKCVIW